MSAENDCAPPKASAGSEEAAGLSDERVRELAARVEELERERAAWEKQCIENGAQWSKNFDELADQRDALQRTHDQFVEWATPQITHYGEMKLEIERLQREVESLRGDLNIARLQRDAKLCSECPRTAEVESLRADVGRLDAQRRLAYVIALEIASYGVGVGRVDSLLTALAAMSAAGGEVKP